VKRRSISYWGTCLAVVLGVTLAVSAPALGEDPGEGAKASAAPIPVRMNPDKLAGVDLPPSEPFITPDQVLEGSHRPRAEVLYQGEELGMEIYEDNAATYAISDPVVCQKSADRKSEQIRSFESGIRPLASADRCLFQAFVRVA